MSNKVLLAAIALGLWANAASHWVQPANAIVDMYLQNIDRNIQALVRGGRGCSNTKICE